MIRHLIIVFVIMVCNLFVFQVAFAVDAAMVKLEPPLKDSITAGERVSFDVVLLAQGQFDGPTYFDLPEIDGAIVMQVSERPTLGSEEISGETYVSARYDFTVYAQRAGSMQVPPIKARFGSKKSYGQPALEHRLQTEPFAIVITAPPGAIAGEVIVSTSELSATETWSPTLVSEKSAKAKVGDAFTRTITIRARDVPAMMLPAPNIGDVAGFAIYPKQPQIRDKTERGDFTGERVDTVTYICERAGSFEIPELSVRWWNPDKKQWQSKSFPAVSLKVAKNPLLKGSSTSSAGAVKSAPDIKTLIGWVFILVAIVVGLYFAVRPIKRSWQAWREKRAASESAQWQRLRQACSRGEAAEVYKELNRWLAHFGLSSHRLTTGTSVAMENTEGVSEGLRSASITLQQRLAGLDVKWDAQIFLDELIGLRQQLRASIDTTTTQTLPLLNP